MALILHQPGTQPLGQFDGYTGETLNFNGGEVCSWRALPYPASGASDVNSDGYVNEGGLGFVVPAISRTWNSTGAAPLSSAGPFFLSDEGINHYGTLFGAVVGGFVGQQVNGPNTYTGAVLGPHTATGSGKVTVWDKPGLYGVTLDAVDSTNLAPSVTTLTVGQKLYFTAAGLLTTSVGKVANGLSVGSLASFETNGSLVTTPGSLVAALNSPSGDVTSLKPNNFYQVVFWFAGAAGYGA